VTVDECDRCRGRWLDAHEIDKLTGRTGITDWLRAAAQASPPPVCIWCHHQQTRHGAACERCGGAIGAACPACQVWMPVLEVKGVALDFCVRCGGVWLDAGEQVPDLPARPAPAPPAAPAAASGARPEGAAAPSPAGRPRRPRYHAPVAPAGPVAPPPAYPPPAPPPAAAAPTAGYVQTPVRVAPPQPYSPPPVVTAPVTYAPYWGAPVGYYPYANGYWYDGYWYDPAAATAAGVALGVGAAATAGAMYPLLDWGFDLW
jgi:Zn-finger nucleic acid-binding protein